MDVVALVSSRDHVCTRYRIAQFQKHLEAVGLGLRIEPLAPRIADRAVQLTRRRAGEVVFLQRQLLPVWQILLLRRSARLLVYDFDDAVFLRDSFHPRGSYSLKRRLRFRATVQLADLVFAGNNFLADAAQCWTKANKIQVIPTCVDPTLYSTTNHDDRPPTRLAWIGSSSTLRSLEGARGLLEEIGRTTPRAVLRVICDRFPQFEHLTVEPAPWSRESEPRDLRASDIGISWVPDDAWSRGKCGLKVLQYMAAGLPVVASPVGVHAEMVSQGAGFLPRTVLEWIERVRELAGDPGLRSKMGLIGRRRVETHFALPLWGPVLAGRLAEAAAAL